MGRDSLSFYEPTSPMNVSLTVQVKIQFTFLICLEMPTFFLFQQYMYIKLCPRLHVCGGELVSEYVLYVEKKSVIQLDWIEIWGFAQ